MTDTTNAANARENEQSLADKAKGYAATAGDKAREYAAGASDKVSAAASSTAEAAKEHPYAAAAIGAGVVAAVAGAALGVAKLREGDEPAAKSSGGKTKAK